MLDFELIPAPQKGSPHLFVMLHGLGDSSAGYHWLPGVLDLPQFSYLLVNAPDASNGGFSWFDYPANMGPGILRSRHLLSELLDRMPSMGFPHQNTTLAGFSQGCLMTLDVGLRYPHKLAGLVGISGWVFELNQLLLELSPVADRQRILATHGLYDPLIPLPPVREQMARLKSAGLKVTWKEFPKAHTIHGEEEISLIRQFLLQGMT